MVVGPGGAQPLGNLSTVRRRLLGRQGRASGARPAFSRRPVPRRTMPTSSSSRAQCPRSSYRRTVALARSATAASDSGGARILHRLLGGSAQPGQPEPASLSSVGHLAEDFPRARTSRFALALSSFGREHRRGARRRRRRSAWRRSFRRGPRSLRPLATPGRAAWRREPSLGDSSKSHRLVTSRGSSYPGMGTV
jgi:hypothetical protein